MRAIILARVSTEEQARPDKVSLDQQIEYGEKWAADNGAQIVRTYRESGVSGAKPLAERPQIQAILNSARRGEFDILIVAKWDRLARSLVQGLTLINILEKDLGLSVVSASEGNDEMTRDIFLLMAKFERKRILQRTADGRRGAIQAGKYPGGKRPYGYVRNEDGFLEIDEDEAAIMREIFRLAGEGVSTYKIARKLEDEHVPAREGMTWSPGAIAKRLKNPLYRGAGMTLRMAQNPEAKKERRTYDEFKIDAPAIVDETTWAKAQRRKFTQAGGGRKHKHGLVGGNAIFHLHDDGKLTKMYAIKRQPEGKRVYRCSAIDKGTDRCPGFGNALRGQRMISLNAPLAEGTLLRTLVGALRDPKAMIELRAKADARVLQIGEAENAIEAGEKRLGALEQKRSRQLELYTEGLIDRAKLDSALANIDVEESKVSEALNRARSDLAGINPMPTIEDLMKMPIEAPSDLDALDEDALADWLNREATRMLTGLEPELEATLDWVAKLRTTFDATLVVSEGPTIEVVLR